ncbi:hypothetical protein ABIA45_002906 [Bradyrhizobium sp. USDA 336]
MQEARRFRGADNWGALLPDEGKLFPQTPPVIPREGGVSSTPRPLGSTLAVSGILDCPPPRAIDTEYGAKSYFADNRTIWRPPFISLRLLTKFSGRCQRWGTFNPMNSAMSPMKPVQFMVSAFQTGELACNSLM